MLGKSTGKPLADIKKIISIPFKNNNVEKYVSLIRRKTKKLEKLWKVSTFFYFTVELIVPEYCN